MEQSIIQAQKSKEQWLNDIEDILIKSGYVKETDDNYIVYTMQYTGTVRGSTMIINGQRIDQPGTQVVVKNTIKIGADGFISDNNNEETNKEEFTEVIFDSTVNNNERKHLEEFILWSEDLDSFKGFVNWLR